MFNDLVRNASIVLQDIEIHGAGGLGNFLRDGLWTYTFVSCVPTRQSFRVSEGPCGSVPKVLVAMQSNSIRD